MGLGADGSWDGERDTALLAQLLLFGALLCEQSVFHARPLGSIPAISRAFHTGGARNSRSRRQDLTLTGWGDELETHGAPHQWGSRSGQVWTAFDTALSAFRQPRVPSSSSCHFARSRRMV